MKGHRCKGYFDVVLSELFYINFLLACVACLSIAVFDT